MSGLPAALAPWAEALSIFPEKIQLSIGPWLPRLAATLGPTRSRVDMRAGDPDGYAGLARRGPYDRLLLSEWLYAMEAPAEFVRRASMNELVFVELARRAPVGSHRSVVLLDAGPSQIGSPRLVGSIKIFTLHE